MIAGAAPMPGGLRTFLAISIALHAIVLAAQVIVWPSGPRRTGPRVIDVQSEYHPGTATGAALARQSLRQLGERPGAEVPEASVSSPQIRVPERALLGMPAPSEQVGGTGPGGSGPAGDGAGTGFGVGVEGGEGGGGEAARAPVVDLTNLTEASQGDPVLLIYFGAIRERIERTATSRTWTAADSSAQGLVYCAFVLERDGSIHGFRILEDRSARSDYLHDITKTIIENSVPFPPFPPSLADAARTIVIPLDFVPGA